MIGVELKGWKPLSKKLKWIKKNWPLVQKMAMARMAEELASELRVPNQHLHYVTVNDGVERIWYGISLEPEPFDAPPDEYTDYLYYLMPTETAPTAVKELAERNPYTYSTLPRELPGDGSEGTYFLREATQDEIDEATLRSLIANDEKGVEPASSEKVQPLQDDIRYNQARGELGIGDGTRRPIWRQALKKLIRKRLPDILDEVSDALIAGDIKENELPSFETRTTDWLEANGEFMLIAVRI